MVHCGAAPSVAFGATSPAEAGEGVQTTGIAVDSLSRVSGGGGPAQPVEGAALAQFLN